MQINAWQLFFGFLAKPDIHRLKIGLVHKIWLLIQFLSISLVIGLLLGALSNYLSGKAGFRPGENYIINNFLLTSPIWLIVFAVCIYGPILEEILFRLYLNFKKSSLIIATTFISFSLLPYLIVLLPNYRGLSSTDLVSVSIFISFVIGLITGIYLKGVPQSKLEFIGNKYARTWFWISVIIFAVIHATNFANISSYIYLIPLIVSPQLWAGTLFAAIRLKLGFWWSTSLHCLYNFILIINICIFKLFFDKQTIAKILTDSSNLESDIAKLQNSQIILFYTLFSGLTILYILIIGVFVYTIVEFTRKILKTRKI